MAEYKMTAKEAILTAGSSRGSQIKFHKGNYWYKIDESGPEGKAEELASKILSCSNLIHRILDNEPDSRMKDIALFSIEKYQKVESLSFKKLLENEENRETVADSLVMEHLPI
ncbi:MAG: hypothetical protein IJ695_08120 [Butyrivibrio sp.]|nr:hypothetical protein [Butyrivibrio sp.]